MKWLLLGCLCLILIGFWVYLSPISYFEGNQNSPPELLLYGTEHSSDRVTKDEANVYIEDKKVTNPTIDVSTFEFIEGTTRGGGYALFKDKDFVYSFERSWGINENPAGELIFRVIEEADPSSFVALYDGFIGYDKDRVFVRREMVPGSSPDNLKVVTMFWGAPGEGSYPGYFISGTKLYSSNNVSEPIEIDLATFEVIDTVEHIFKDKNGTYIRP